MPTAPNTQPNERTTEAWVSALQRELDKHNKNYQGGPPVGNPRPVSELLKGLSKPEPGVGAKAKKSK